MPLNTSGLHGIFALVAFVFFNVEALAAATLVSGPMRWVSVVAGMVGLAFVVLMVIGDAGNPGLFGPIGHGGAERMIVYPSMLWMMAFGGYLMASPSGRGRLGTKPVRRLATAGPQGGGSESAGAGLTA